MPLKWEQKLGHYHKRSDFLINEFERLFKSCTSIEVTILHKRSAKNLFNRLKIFSFVC